MRRIAHPQCRARPATTLVLLVFFAVALSGCGRESANAQAAATPTAVATDAAASGSATPPNATANVDWPLVPLTQADVDLYLDVMRAAAGRLRHPTAQDIAAPGLARTAEAKLQQGHPELVTSAESDAVSLAGSLQGQADYLIVDARHIDLEHYQHVVDRVKDAIVPPQFDFQADGDSDIGSHYVPTAHDRAVEATRNANIKLLAPHRDEIRALQTVVRDMTPKDSSG